MLCGQMEVKRKMEDELHVVFECHYYGNLREYPRWKKLYENRDISMINFMNQKDQYTLAHYITVLLRCRKEGLRHHRGIDFFHLQALHILVPMMVTHTNQIWLKRMPSFELSERMILRVDNGLWR